MSCIKKIKTNFGPLTVSYASMVFEGAMLTMLVAIMGPLAARLNVESSSISLLLALQGIGIITTSYLAGTASDKFGRKNVILAGILFYSVFLIGMIFTKEFYLACFLSLLSGMGQGMMDPPAISLLIDVFGDDNGPAMSLVFVFFSFGAAMSSVIAKKIVEMNLDCSLLFYVFIVLAALLSAVVLKSKYPVQPTAGGKSKMNAPQEKIVVYAAIFLIVVTSLFYCSETIIRTWIGTYAAQILKISPADGIAMLTYFEAGSIVGAIIFSFLLTRIHASKLMIVNGVLATVILGLFLRFHCCRTFSMLAVGALVIITYSFSLNLAGEVFKDAPGGGTGLIVAVKRAASVLITYATGRHLHRFGVEKVLYLGLILLFAAAIVSFIYRQLSKKGLKHK